MDQGQLLIVEKTLHQEGDPTNYSEVHKSDQGIKPKAYLGITGEQTSAPPWQYKCLIIIMKLNSLTTFVMLTYAY